VITALMSSDELSVLGRSLPNTARCLNPGYRTKYTRRQGEAGTPEALLSRLLPPVLFRERQSLLSAWVKIDVTIAADPRPAKDAEVARMAAHPLRRR
jgi:hypothetical protein